MPTASNAWVIAPARTADGHAVLYNGPQQGFYNPSFVHGIGLHGAGHDVTGITPVGLLPVLFGTNGRIAWGSTVGSLDTNDIYQEALNPAHQYEYFHHGAYRPMTRRTETIKVKGAADRTVDIYATVHGFVQSWDVANARAYTVKTSWRGREVETLLGWAHAAQAQNWTQFLAQAERVSASITWFYADVDGNIGAAGLGRMPRRPAVQDIRFPARGDGSMEWDGALPFSQNPKVLNPAQGYVASWNNQIAAGLRADSANFSFVDRANEIEVQVQGKARLGVDDVWKIGESAALADLNARYFVPLIVQAAAGLPPGDPVRQAADQLSAWDLKNRDSDGDGRYDSPATTVLRVWLGAMARRVLQDEAPLSVFAPYANLGYPTLTPRGSPGSAQPAAVAKLLWNALAGKASGVPQSYDFFNGQDHATVIRGALSDAVLDLTKQHGADMGQWLTPVVKHRFSHLNAIGVPWASASDQPEVSPYLNRGTANYRVVLKKGAVSMCSVVAPGQSGFVGPGEVPAKHRRDQLALFQSFGCKPERLTAAEVDADVQSTQQLQD
jgi:penicillin amidase